MSHKEMAENLGDLIEWLDVEIPELKELLKREKEYQASLIEKVARIA